MASWSSPESLSGYMISQIRHWSPRDVVEARLGGRDRIEDLCYLTRPPRSCWADIGSLVGR